MVSVITASTPYKTMSIQQIMEELFYNNDKPIQLLKKHDLEDLFESSIQIIKGEIEKRPIDFGKFRDLASSILISVNSKLREIDDSNERGYLELILKEVSDYLLAKIIRSTGNSQRLISEIRSALETTSSVKGYDFEALVALLKLNNDTNRSSSKRVKSSIFYYDWNGSGRDLDELLQTLKSEGWITSVREFRKLFDEHNDENLTVHFSPTKVIDLLALFDELKERELITPRGNRGHFHPFRQYLVDFENNFLFNNDPKLVKQNAKRSPGKWEKMIKNAQLWIGSYKTNATLKLPSPR